MSDADRLRQLHAFRRTFELGSLSAAARSLGIGQPAISKHLAALERRLRARLLLRSTHGLSPTSVGRAFYASIAPLLDALDAAEDSIASAAEELEGPLSLHVPVGLGEVHLTRALLAFQTRYPGIRLDVRYDDRLVDLISEGVDVSFRIGPLTSPALVVRRIAMIPRLLAATRSYLDRHGRPATPEALERHNFVRYSRLRQGEVLTLERDGRQVSVHMTSTFLVDNALAIRTLLDAGHGIALVPRWLIHEALEARRLEVVLPEWKLSPAPLHAVYPSATLKPKRVTLVVAFLVKALADVPGLITVSGSDGEKT